MKKWFFISFLLMLLAGCASASYIAYHISGELSLVGGMGISEETLIIYRSKKNGDNYVLKVKRNSLDSRFLKEGVELVGWIDIPIPVPFISDVRKKHTIKYRNSDQDWDYLTLELQ